MHAEETISSFILLNESTLEKSLALKDWLQSWTTSELEFLKPRDRFLQGHDIVEGEYEENVDGLKWMRYRKGTFVWAPAPPAASEPALEELRKMRHWRTCSTHIVLIPRLLTPTQRKRLNKVSRSPCVVCKPA